jgi:DNA polymerase-1
MQLCRKAIYARPGHQLLSVDFSGIEVRMAGIYTQDEKLIYDILHGDMHKDMAIELYKLDSLDKQHEGEKNLRQGGKNGFVFPQFYGDYYANCAYNLLKWAKISSLANGTPALEHLSNKGLIRLSKKGAVANYDKFIEHVKQVEDRFWNERYRGYSKWKDRVWRQYKRTGYVDMLTGFRCSGIMNKKDVNNYPFQGTAFHCLLKTFIEVDKIQQEENWDSRLVCQIHDELTVDTHPDELMHVAKTIVDVATKKLPEIWDWINILLEVEADLTEVDESWADKKFFST